MAIAYGFDEDGTPSDAARAGIELVIDEYGGGGGGATALGDLTDVDTTGATTGQVLTFDGSEWSPDAPSAGTVTSTSISDSTATGRAVLTAANAATARTAIGAATAAQGDKADAAIPSGLVDAKGDLIVGTADNTVTRLPAGTNGHVLTADSTVAAGVKWAASAGGGGGGATGSVQFVVGGKTSAESLASSTFTTYPLNATPTTNIGGGTWDAGNFTFEIPSDGLYLCLAGIRADDGMTTRRSVAIGVGTTNADGAHVLWRDMGDSQAAGSSAARHGAQYQRLTRFNDGDLVRLYIYSDGATFPINASGSGQFLNIVKVAD